MKIEKIAVVTNYNIPDKLSAAMAVSERLCTHISEIFVPENYKDRIFRGHNHRSAFTYMSYDEIYKKSDLVVVIGGDGVMLEAARRATASGIPILGINMGRVGYMTELEMNELDLLDNIFTEKFYLDERAMLKVDIRSSQGQSRFAAYALNEAVIAKGATARIIDFQLSDNGRLVSEYRADGIVVATPTGSTAYSLSAGGPIVSHDIDCILATPICAHNFFNRSIIFKDTEKICLCNVR